jgi:hypothetical protein
MAVAISSRGICVALVAEDVAEDLAALALPVRAHAAQILVHVVHVAEADRLHLDDARHDVRGHRVGPGVVEQVVGDLLHVAGGA